jgi:hypothetical protein
MCQDRAQPYHSSSTSSELSQSFLHWHLFHIHTSKRVRWKRIIIDIARKLHNSPFSFDYVAISLALVKIFTFCAICNVWEIWSVVVDQFFIFIIFLMTHNEDILCVNFLQLRRVEEERRWGRETKFQLNFNILLVYAYVFLFLSRSAHNQSMRNCWEKAPIIWNNCSYHYHARILIINILHKSCVSGKKNDDCSLLIIHNNENSLSIIKSLSHSIHCNFGLKLSTSRISLSCALS